MIEGFLVFIVFLLVASIIVYFYFREVHQTENVANRISTLDAFYTRMINNQNDFNASKDVLLRSIITESNNSLKEIVQSKDKLAEKSFMEYLKHIERLEKMVLPKPITKKMVEDVMSNTPPMVENEIDKADKQAESENIMDILARIPITADTKVGFEGDVGDLVDEGPSEEVLKE